MASAHVTCDVLVAGAGPAGLTAACLLAQGGVNVVAVGPAAGTADTRTTALFGGATRLLGRIGATEALAGLGAPLEAMRIIDRLDPRRMPSTLHFPASEIGLSAFGLNYRNTDLLFALENVAGGLGHLTRVIGEIEAYAHDDESVTARLADGSEITARLVVAADGRKSIARQAAGIGASSWRYRQTALAFQVGHSLPHGNASVEIHHEGGPLTFIPLPSTRCAVNWLMPPREAERLAALEDADFLKALETASGGALGVFREPGERAVFPISGLKVETLAQNRTALVGEAAHVLPPIGAQGLNLGFRDAATIAELVGEAVSQKTDPGSAELLAAYAARRKRDIVTRRAATDLFNRSLLLGTGVVAQLRGLGFVMLAASATARKALMRRGIVNDSDLPTLMQEPPGQA